MKRVYIFLMMYSICMSINNRGHSQNNDNKKCLLEHKVQSITSYHVIDPNNSASTAWRLTDRSEYDVYGNETRWMQFHSDTTTYSYRAFEYNKQGVHIKTVQSADNPAEALIDSIGLDQEGEANYRKMFYRSGETIVECKIRIDSGTNLKPLKVSFSTMQDELQSYELFFYNESGKIKEERSCTVNGMVTTKRIYVYDATDTIKEIKTYGNIKGVLSLLETDVYNAAGLLIKEIHYDHSDIGKVSYYIDKMYNKQNMEIKNINYSIYFDKPCAARMETIEYNAACLKVKTTIYSIDVFSHKKSIYTIVKYVYAFHDQ